MSKQSRTEIYAFIDSQNLNLGTSKDITVRNKKIVIPNSHSESKLLSKFSKYKVYIQYEKDKLAQEISNKKGRRNN